MEIILLQDVKSLGKKGEVVKVSDGYARNYVLPKKLGVEANAKNLNDLKLQKAREDRLAKEKLDEAKALAENMKDKKVVLSIKTGKGGRSFGSVSSKEIAQAAAEQAGLEFDKKKLVLNEPIKSPGTYILDVRIHKDVVGKLTVQVVEE